MQTLLHRIVSFRRRIALYVLVGAMVVIAYTTHVLPPPADVLLDCFLYLSVATTFTPLPSPPPIVHAATQAPVLLVAMVAAAGTTVAYLLEYAALKPIIAHRRLEHVRTHPTVQRLAAAFDRLPFLALSIAAFLPLPVDGVRLMAIARGYDRRRYALAAFIGRLPRYALIAGLGYGLRFFGPVEASGATSDPELGAVLARLDRAAERLDTAHGRFHQERWSPAFAEPERSRGELWFRRPSDLVLRYREPDEQMVFVDSLGVWIHLVKEKQAQRYRFTTPAERDAALAVLWQPSRVLASLYVIARAPETPHGEKPGEWLLLSPRDSELAQAVERVYMRFDAKLGLSDCVIVEQKGGERGRLEVDDIERNPELPGSRFRFQPPPGVEVVRF
jgi:outer membrane lipoprotein carrier protein